MKAPRTRSEDIELRAAGYEPSNHPAWMKLDYLLESKRQLQAKHETSLSKYMPRKVVQTLAQSFLDRTDEDWTWIDPEDVRRLARAVLDRDQFKFDEARIAEIERFRP